MAITNTHQTIDILIHADIVSKRDRTANNSSVNPNRKDVAMETNSNNNEGSPRKISSKRIAHMGVNISRTAVNLSMTFRNAAVNQLANITGDSSYQDYSRRQTEILEDTARVATNTITATLSGAMIGGPVGASIAFASSALTQSLSYMQKYETRNINTAIQNWKDTQSINYNKARAGVDLTDGRSRLR